MQSSSGARHSLSTLGKWVSTVGFMATLEFLLVRVGRRLKLGWPAQWKVHPRQAQWPVTIRLRGSSDLDVFGQIFVQEEYATLRSLNDIKLVLDLGANVGYASTYFLTCFPGARIMAVEPDDRNVAMSRLNLEPYGDRATLLHGAVWAESAKLSLSKGTFGDGREWATQVAQPTDGASGDVQGWDVGALIDMAGSAGVDLLKVDIERAELSVFGPSAQKWLHRVRNLSIELHGPDCEETFFNALAGFDYELEHSGELTICKNLRAKTAAAQPAAQHVH